MREIMVIEAPIQEPYICAKCGVGGGDRPYFVDLGIDNEFVQQNQETRLPHYTIGCIYFCSECFQSAFSSVNRLVFTFLNQRINSNLNASQEKRQAFEIQLQENAHLKKELDRVNAELHASKKLFQETFEKQIYDPVVPEMAGHDLIDTLLGAEENGPGNDSDAPTGADSDSEGNDSGIDGSDSAPSGESAGIKLPSFG